MSQAFVQGNIDAMFAWEPYNYNASSKIPSMSASWPTSTDLYSGRTTAVMNATYLNSHSQVAEGIIKGLMKAEDYIKNNPDSAKKIVMDRTGMSASALNALWSGYAYKVELDDGFQSILNNEASWIKTSGGSKSTVDPSKIVNATFLQAVDSTSVGKAWKH
jgi:ABC-type nitrate/sulfonate/bicarbonate transport system substrate-binding protein